MAKKSIRRWTENEIKSALYLYFQLPFGKIHSGNPEIIDLAHALDRTPSSIAMKLANFASLDPKIIDTGRTGLSGASSLDREIWNAFHNDWTRLISEAAKTQGPIPPDDIRENNEQVRDKSADFIFETYAGTGTSSAVVEQRLGQNFFRRAVIANYDEKCCVTGIADVRLLNASHIVPWAIDRSNRHNPRNGLCLSATFDRAFDRGLMCIDLHGRTRFSSSLLQSSNKETRLFFGQYEGKEISLARRMQPDPIFLQWHQDNCFEVIRDDA